MPFSPCRRLIKPAAAPTHTHTLVPAATPPNSPFHRVVSPPTTAREGGPMRQTAQGMGKEGVLRGERGGWEPAPLSPRLALVTLCPPSSPAV